MKNAQVINFSVLSESKDSVLAFDGDNVIDDTDQETLGIDKHLTFIVVNVDLFDLMSNSSLTTITGITMTYHSLVDFWTINIPDIYTEFNDRHKYVGLVSQPDPKSDNMRSFKIKEFCTDNDSFEEVWMRLPYQVEIGGGTAYIRWYPYTDLEFLSSPVFEAPAYQGGTGIVYATSPANVTHRGLVAPL
jgi:hypothetical protein